MSKILAYASSTRPNHLWSAAQFNNALPKNRADADIPLVAQSEMNVFKGKYRALLKLISKTRDRLVHVTDHIEDEGDRRYFGSTNDADDLLAIYHEMMSWIWDAVDETNRMKSDPYADIRKQRARAETAEAALAAKDAALLEIARKTVGVGATMTETIGDGRPRIKINFDTVEEMRSFVDGLRALRAALSKQESANG